MKYAKKALDDFNAMNRMGSQMMTNMMNKMGQQAQNFGGKPCEGMPDMQKMMAEMQQMNQKAAAMLPFMEGKAKSVAREVVPVMQQQMNEMMEGMQQMNQIALEMMQKTFEYNCKMMNQVFDAMQKMSEEPAKAAKPKEAAPEQEAKEKPAKAAKPKKSRKE